MEVQSGRALKKKLEAPTTLLPKKKKKTKKNYTNILGVSNRA